MLKEERKDLRKTFLELGIYEVIMKYEYVLYPVDGKQKRWEILQDT